MNEEIKDIEDNEENIGRTDGDNNDSNDIDVTTMVDMLKEKDRVVLSLYYYEELTLKEIGKILEVSESRVSQLHSRAIVNLRNAINKLNYNIN